MLYLFKPELAYEMLIIDWSSDACSSHLPPGGSFAESLRYLLRSYLAPLLSDADTKRGHSYLRIVVAQLAHADIRMEEMEAQLQELREQYVEQLSRLFPAVHRHRIEELMRACLRIAAAMPIKDRK